MDEWTEGELNRALFWIKRWKMVGGIFAIEDGRPMPDRKINPDPKQDAAEQRAADALMDELRKDRTKHANIIRLIEHKLAEAMEGPTPANDTGEPQTAA